VEDASFPGADLVGTAIAKAHAPRTPLDVVSPLSFIHVSVGVLHGPVPIECVLHKLASKSVTLKAGESALAAVAAVFPVSLVDHAIDVLHAAISHEVIVHPASLINITILEYKSTLPNLSCVFVV